METIGSTTNNVSTNQNDPYLSVVLPVFNEVENLAIVHEAIGAAVADLGCTAEIIYVDDGSTDGSEAVLRELAENDPRVRVVFLARNYGQTAAMSAGFETARGEVVVSMDADGQNDPGDIAPMLKKLDEGFDVVSGWRHRRKDPWLTRRLPSQIANRLIGWITGLSLHDYGCSLKAYRREFLQEIRLYGEFHRFIPVLAHWQGARVVELRVRHHPRTGGESKYGLERVLKVVVDLLLLRFMGQYGTRPGHFSGMGAFFSALASGLILMIVVIRVFFFEGAWISPAIIIGFFLMGVAIQFLLFGLLSEMVMRTYYESQDRRPYRIREHLSQDAPALN